MIEVKGPDPSDWKIAGQPVEPDLRGLTDEELEQLRAEVQRRFAVAVRARRMIAAEIRRREEGRG